MNEASIKHVFYEYVCPHGIETPSLTPHPPDPPMQLDGEVNQRVPNLIDPGAGEQAALGRRQLPRWIAARGEIRLHRAGVPLHHAHAGAHPRPVRFAHAPAQLPQALLVLQIVGGGVDAGRTAAATAVSAALGTAAAADGPRSGDKTGGGGAGTAAAAAAGAAGRGGRGRLLLVAPGVRTVADVGVATAVWWPRHGRAFR
jgi:hypothetical protein